MIKPTEKAFMRHLPKIKIFIMCGATFFILDLVGKAKMNDWPMYLQALLQIVCLGVSIWIACLLAEYIFKKT
ncbi:unnamed protein product, partial [marine sediment metagenome]